MQIGGLSLTEISRIQATDESSVYLMQGADGVMYVLKKFAESSRSLAIERDFYERHRGRAFEFIHVPRLVDSGRSHLLLEYVERESQSRDSILERSWSLDDRKLWVDGLLEFQRLRPARGLYSLRRRVTSPIYPAIDVARRCGSLSSGDGIRAARLIAAYLYFRPSIRYVCTHFDLHTTNFAFMANERRMSMLDFRLPYYLGDPYLDVLYYLSIPAVEIEKWTFQGDLLRTFLEKVSALRGYNAGRRLRVRMLLMMSGMARATYFRDEPARREIYLRNVRTVLDGGAFDSLWRSWGVADI